MSLLAHATYAAGGLDMHTLRKAQDAQIQAEIIEAKRIQKQIGCSWGEALRIATGKPLLVQP